ncbi:MAG: ribbon-helix-helix domain-containing protein [Halobacteria archaeon]
MPETDTDTDNINIRINTELLEEIDQKWQEQGYNSRSEFIRQACRDAVKETTLAASTLETLAVSAEQARQDKFVERDELKDEFLEAE